MTSTRTTVPTNPSPPNKTMKSSNPNIFPNFPPPHQLVNPIIFSQQNEPSPMDRANSRKMQSSDLVFNAFPTALQSLSSFYGQPMGLPPDTSIFTAGTTNALLPLPWFNDTFRSSACGPPPETYQMMAAGGHLALNKCYNELSMASWFKLRQHFASLVYQQQQQILQHWTNENLAKRSIDLATQFFTAPQTKTKTTDTTHSIETKMDTSSSSEQILSLKKDRNPEGNSFPNQNTSTTDMEQHHLTGDSLEISSLSMDSGEVCVDDLQVSPADIPLEMKEDLCSPRIMEDSSSSSTICTSSPSKRKKSGFQSGITIGYTYDAFFISDGRARKKSLLSTASTSSINAVENEPTNLKAIALDVVEKSSNKLTTTSSRQRYTCSECGKDYATSSNLSRHKQTHRSLDSKMAKSCPHCDKVYVSMPALSMHILTHDLKHKCHVCGKCFSRPWLLHGHLRAHTGEKPYGCAHCGRAFADRSNLRAHMQTHSAMKHFECGQCGKTFALKSYLNKHIESSCSAVKSVARAESSIQP